MKTSSFDFSYFRITNIFVNPKKPKRSENLINFNNIKNNLLIFNK